MAKYHLEREVSGTSMLSMGQWPEEHETPIADFGFKPVLAGDETDMRKFTNYSAMDEVQSVPHHQIRAGQQVVSTKRAYDIAREKPGGIGEGVILPSGEVMMQDGHHRLVADHINGKNSTKVRITGRYDRRPGEIWEPHAV